MRRSGGCRGQAGRALRGVSLRELANSLRKTRRGREVGREGGREGRREGGRERGRERERGGREGGGKRGQEGGREGGKERGISLPLFVFLCLSCVFVSHAARSPQRFLPVDAPRSAGWGT